MDIKKSKKGKIQKSFIVDVSKSTPKALLRNSPLLYYQESQFTTLVRSFSSSIVTNKIAEFTKDTGQLFNFYSTFIMHDSYEFMDLDVLLNKIEGYLLLELCTSNSTKKKLDKCNIESQVQYITSGTYFSPFAAGLVQNTYVKGIQLDTTWTIIDKYVTSIPTLIIGNVGMPIGFSFSLTEDYLIYDYIFKNFENAFGFKIEDYVTVAQSDQGKPLRSCIKDHSFQHLCCLRHLLVSLGTKKFSYQVGELVSATCRTDYNELAKTYEQS